MSFNSTIILKIEKAEPVESDEFIGVFEGIASTPDIDNEGDRFTPEVLARNAENLREKPILLYHGKGETGPTPIGKILEARFEDGVLKIKAGIYKAFSNIWEKIKTGIYKALSVGGVARGFRKLANGVREIFDAEIREVSIAHMGKNPRANIIFAFGKAYMPNEEGVLVELDEKMYKSYEFEKIDYELPILETTSWDGSAAAKRILDWAETEDEIDKSKASKLFLVVEGEGKNRTDYSWPVGDIRDGRPYLSLAGIKAAIVYAAGARGVRAPEEVKKALERLVARLKREGYLDDDYEVPWKREEKSTSLEELKNSIEEIKKMIEEMRNVKIEKSEEKPVSEKPITMEKREEMPKTQVSGVEPRPEISEAIRAEAKRVLMKLLEE